MAQYIRNDNCEAILIDDEYMILNQDNFTITKMNQTGGFCWELLHDVQTVNSLKEAINSNYAGADASAEEADILSFLDELLGYGLVRYANQ